ncbi:MAG TPA: HEAT repeat domain-containing protein [Terriglobia bacterium]|nr:HEAT repeat domain-containing protein [Terriglobia bacterium]
MTLTLNRMRVQALLVAVVSIAALLGAARAMGQTQTGVPAHLVNARVETRSAAAGLEQAFRAIESAQTEPAWIAYAVPAVPGRHEMCCGPYHGDDASETCCGRCRLEGESHDGFTMNDHAPESVKLEALSRALILFRMDGKKVEKIRVFSSDCELDAGGRTVHWLADVKPEDSVRLLASFVAGQKAQEADEDSDSWRLTDGALAAIAVHADPAADTALEQFVAASQPERLREKAAFWLGAERGRRGFEVLDRLVRHDPSDQFREKAVFAIFVSHESRATDTLIDVARNDSSGHVRGQALFWLAQAAGHKTEEGKAATAIRQAIDNDPETEVKKKAVFALSQLPKDQGVPLLIQVARNNHNPAVRKQAMFWLGQSGDSRALAFFEDVLSH